MYEDEDGNDTETVHCTSVDCSTKEARYQNIDDTLEHDSYHMVIRPNGLPLFAYANISNDTLNVFACGDLSCDSAQDASATVEASLDTGADSIISLVLDRDGMPTFAFTDSDDTLKLARCTTADCMTGGLGAYAIIDNSIGALDDINLQIGLDGFPVMAYTDYGQQSVKVSKCTDNACSSVITTTLLDYPINFDAVDMAIGTDGNPILIIRDTTNSDVYTYHCGNAACNTEVSGDTITFAAGAAFSGATLTINGANDATSFASGAALRIVSSISGSAATMTFNTVTGSNLSVKDNILSNKLLTPAEPENSLNNTNANGWFESLQLVSFTSSTASGT